MADGRASDPPRPPAWWRRRIGLAAVAIALALALGFGVRWGDRALYPPRGDARIGIYVVSNGFHSGLVLPRPELGVAAGRLGLTALSGVATRFGDYDWLEFGWGEAEFYRVTPTIASIDVWLALRALFRPGNAGLVHVAGIEGDPHPFFGSADLVRIELSPEGLRRMLARLERSLAHDPSGSPEELGPGLYGPSLFYRARGVFSFTNVCNHWTARLLGTAGVPTSPLLATLPDGLLLDLRWRSGLVPDGPPHAGIAALPAPGASR